MEKGDRWIDVCIFCALYEEVEALLAEFTARCPTTFQKGFSRQTQYAYHYTTIENRRGEPLSILVTWLSKHGPVQAAMDVALFLDEFRPCFAAMTGICAGDQREVRLGDLIVAQCAFFYEEGKIITMPGGKPVQQLETTTLASTSQVLQYVQGFHEWKKPLREMKQEYLACSSEPDEGPRCFIGPMATGMAVRGDDPFPWLRERYNRKVLGLDMEAASFYRAFGTFPHIHALVVKGVSDFGDHTKHDRFHRFAACASAVYLLHFIQEYVTRETMPHLTPSSDPVSLEPAIVHARIYAPGVELAERVGYRGGRFLAEVSTRKRLDMSPETLWTVPHRQNRCFVGRETLIEQISLAFASWNTGATPIVALSGLGGMGKTQIALEYSYRSSGRYQAIFWINASSQEAFVADLVSLVKTLSIEAARDMNTQEHLLLVRHWLEQHQYWLLVLDALTDFSLVLDALPLRSTGHVLVTTQSRASQTIATTLEVGPLVEAEALTLLLRRGGFYTQEYALPPPLPGETALVPEELAAAYRVCKLLDGLPLALDQAGAYIEQTGCSVSEYEKRYHAQCLSLLEQRGESVDNHPASVVTTWSLAFQQVEAHDPSAADLLRACAFLAPEVIPQNICEQESVQLGPQPGDFFSDGIQFDAAIRTLQRFSLVKRDAQTRTLSLHRLVQVVLRALMPPEQQALWAGRVVQALCTSFPRRRTPAWSRCTLYLAHVKACEELLRQYQLVYPLLGSVVYRVGRFFHEHGQYQEAAACYERAAVLCLDAPLTADVDGLPHILESQGWLALGKRRFAEANTFLDQACILKRQIYGDYHPETALTFHALGRVAHAQRHFQEAEQFYRQALSIKEQALGLEDAETATTELALGWLLFDQQKYDQAYRLYQEAFRVRVKVLGTEHVGTAVVFHLLARLAHRQEKYYEAEILFLQALAIKMRVLCVDHPSIAITLQALAQFYQERQRFQDAEKHYKEALRIREQMLGPEHLLTAETLHHLAGCYQEQEQFYPTSGLSFTFQGQIRGFEPQLTLPAPHSSPDSLFSQRRWKLAEDMYQRVLSIRVRLLGRDHPSVQAVVQAYARLLRIEHREGEALLLEEHRLL